MVKIAKRRGALASVCGLAPKALKFLDWFRSGMPGECPDLGTAEDNAWGFVYAPDGRVLWFKPGGLEHFRTPFHATGSGAEYAMGAMAMGASPEQAVAVAMQFDTATGGEITVLRRD